MVSFPGRGKRRMLEVIRHIAIDGWVVRWIGEDGVVRHATFEGAGAEERAREYAAWQQSRMDFEHGISLLWMLALVLPLTMLYPLTIVAGHTVLFYFALATTLMPAGCVCLLCLWRTWAKRRGDH